MPDLGRSRNNTRLPEDLKFFFIKAGVIVFVYTNSEARREEVSEVLDAISKFLNFLYIIAE